jgi:hypothetical protein
MEERNIAGKEGVQSMDNSHLFKNSKYCKICRRPLPSDFEAELCPECEENELFNRVKEFIRSRDVTEYQVADEFGLPLRKVKGWIKEGRIEYKERVEKIKSLHCLSCGEPITFGSYCQRCFKLQNTAKGGLVASQDDNRMRFLEQGKK